MNVAQTRTWWKALRFAVVEQFRIKYKLFDWNDIENRLGCFDAKLPVEWRGEGLSINDADET